MVKSSWDFQSIMPGSIKPDKRQNAKTKNRNSSSLTQETKYTSFRNLVFVVPFPSTTLPKNLCPQSPQPLLQRILLLRRRLHGLRRLLHRINLARIRLCQLLVQLQPRIIRQLAQQLMHSIIADLHRSVLRHGVLINPIGHGVLFVLAAELLEGQERLFGVGLALGALHRAGGLGHHVRHAVHCVVGLDLGEGELGHVGGLVHLGGDGLFGKEHAGFLGGLGGFAFFEELDFEMGG